MSFHRTRFGNRKRRSSFRRHTSRKLPGSTAPAITAGVATPAARIKIAPDLSALAAAMAFAGSIAGMSRARSR
jgi:hypothetical protein